ncbi:Bacterial protein of unknown function (DUF899) [Seminavis robusta]|uniref:DUF899-domain-containing protein n=1 Tax=Seminavis robusta TaxID=568900 RepID=A0A9N8DL07_9STRA|nr:Bacterial protein of unknown function (DUF899) [Seminavis robusta]|eukprot:Sro213_g088470.1 Bacterial protein of unknown function (DUF899) (252) ;mRNA; f:47203-47958
MSPAATVSNDVDGDGNKKAKIHKVVPHEEWVQARKELLEAEKEFSKKKAELAQKRRDMPWEEVKEDYEFEMTGGKVVKLSELCQGEDGTVIIQHFMFKGGDNGCHLCSFFLDGFNSIYPHLKPRANFCAVALASPEDLEKVGKKKGWNFQMVSARKNTFQKDYGVNWGQDDVDSGSALYNYGKQQWKFGTMAPGISVFKKADGKVYHTYSTYAAGLADLNATFALLDITPTGRSETGGSNNMWWVKQKENY